MGETGCFENDVSQQGMRTSFENGIWQQGDVRLSDLAGRKNLPIGVSDFATLVRTSVFVDKSMFIADVLRDAPVVTLFCRPRRFGKSLNLSMLQRFLETPVDAEEGENFAPLFEGLAIWDAEGGRFRQHQGAYPVVRFSLNDAKGSTWEEARLALASSIVAEYMRHGYLEESDRLTQRERMRFAEVADAPLSTGNSVVFGQSLKLLTTLLRKHHGRQAVVLIDEYDAPAMAAYTNGFYDQAVAWLKTWLTGALKDNPALAFAVLTGVQRISKESIFSDLNNLKVSTPLNVASDERFGFTQAEVGALASYLGKPESAKAAREWYDGYRFGNANVYNPWSVLSYFDEGCIPDVYWGNTSSNGVVGDMVRAADDRQLASLYRLLEPGGWVEAPLDTRVVFPDVGVRPDALWPMLYLSGYVTTDDVKLPGHVDIMRRLRIPNREVALLFRSEILDRFRAVAGGSERMAGLHCALLKGDAEALETELEEILLGSASCFDLVSENSYHMLVMGLLFGVPGYGDPVSNRERGRGRFDVQLSPNDSTRNPLITVELKFAKGKGSGDGGGDNGSGSDGDGRPERLAALANEALSQIIERAYDIAPGNVGSLRWGLAFCGKSVAATCERT